MRRGVMVAGAVACATAFAVLVIRENVRVSRDRIEIGRSLGVETRWY